MGLTAEQLEMRRSMITASDTYVLAGEGYSDQSPLQVYLSKVSDSPGWQGNVYTRIGEMLEPLLMDLLAEQRGLTLTQGTTERHPIIPWLGATPDRNVVDEKGRRYAVVEGKAVMNPRSAAAWETMPPDRVVIQATIQMLVARVRVAYVPAIVLGDFRIWELELDNENLGPALLEMDEEFWTTHVVPRVPPPPDATEASARALRELYPRVKGGLVRASQEVEEAAREWFAADRQLTEIAARQLAAENLLKAAIGEHAQIAGDGWMASWLPRKGSVSWKKAFEALGPKVHPAVLEQFRSEETRTFGCKPIKKG